jgi:DNA repair protein RadA/Sms
MDQLNAFATRLGIAIIAVRHWTKTATSEPIYRGAGNHAITAAALSELVIGEDPADPSQLVLAQLKSNLAPLGKSVI